MQRLNVIILCTKCKCSAPVCSKRDGLVQKVLDNTSCAMLVHSGLKGPRSGPGL